MKDKIARVVDSRETKAGLYFDYTIQVLILLSILAFTIETIPDLEPSTIRLLHYFEMCCIAVFTVEYLLRIYIAEKN